MLLGEDALGKIVHEGVLVVVAYGQRCLALHDHMVLLDLADLVQVDDERAVDAHELA